MKSEIWKKRSFALLFLALCLVLFLGNLWKIRKPVKEYLAGEGFTVAGLEEVLTEQLWGKMNFVEAYGLVQVLLNKRECNDFAYIRDEDGFLHYASFYQEDSEELFEYALRVKRMQDYGNARGAEVLFVMPPGKYVKGITRLRKGMPVNDPGSRVDELLFYLKRLGVETLDLRESFPGEELTYEETFFRTDHHWTIPAAFYATEVLVEKIRQSFGENLDPGKQYLNRSRYEKITYPSLMLGSMGRKTGAVFGGVEDFTALWPRFRGRFQREYTKRNGRKGRLEGSFVEALMKPEVLQRKELYSESPYSLYLDAINSYERLTNLEKPEGCKILMLRDSYFSPVMAFLAPLCGEIHAFWSLESEKLGVEEYLKENKFDYIIVEVYPYNINGEAFDYFKEQ